VRYATKINGKVPCSTHVSLINTEKDDDDYDYGSGGDGVGNCCGSDNLLIVTTCWGVPSIATTFSFLILLFTSLHVLASIATDSTPKQVIVTDATGCNPQKLKKKIKIIVR
jgi:hypothetical protein